MLYNDGDGHPAILVFIGTAAHTMTYDPTHYLTHQDIINLAWEAIGRQPEIRDLHLLRAAAARPALGAFGQDAYPTLLDKAAALMHSLAAHHLFFDGNKRTATHVTDFFLRRNGVEPLWTVQQAYDFVLEIAQSKHNVESVAAWLAAHTSEVNTP